MTDNFAAAGRAADLERMSESELDVLVIGGGITGAGIALDAQSRGMRTGLVEMQDFAAGTSSRSTKLVHGGLRYLKQLEIKMVAEVGRERAVVYENGPHVTVPERMLLPIYKGGTFGSLSTSFGLAVYDRLAGVRRGERRRMLKAADTLRAEPLLRREGLLGGGSYVEYRTDDARLTIEVMKKAAALGALAVNYVKAERLIVEDGRLAGIEAVDGLTGERRTVRARQIVNAAGPWVDTIRELDGSRHGKTLRLTKGVHLVFDGARFPLRQAVYFDTPDGRMMFAIPREGKTYVGTTDTDYTGDPVHPGITAADRDYVLAAADAMFPGLGLTAADIESGWAGLRPLIYEEGKSPSEISRKDEIFHSPSGLLTIAGGKLTGYRRMAETVTDRVAAELRKRGAGPFGPCRTKRLPISGGDVGGSAGLERHAAEAAGPGRQAGLSEQEAAAVARRYGSNAGRVFELAAAAPPDEQARQGLPIGLYAMLQYAMVYERAVTPADFLIRRTGLLFFDIGTVHRFRDAVTALMAQHLEYGEAAAERLRAELDRALADMPAADSWAGAPRK